MLQVRADIKPEPGLPSARAAASGPPWPGAAAALWECARVELGLHGVLGWVVVRLMKGKASSATGILWPIIPNWGDRQVCLITWTFRKK